MQALDVLTRYQGAASSVARERILLDAYSANCAEFFETMRLAADPFVVFGVSKVAEILEDDGAAGSLTFAEFRALCDGLCTGAWTDDVKRRAIRQAAERCHTATWNLLYRRVLLKHADIISLPLLRRVYKRLGHEARRFHIPAFRCQMATYIEDISMLTGSHFVEVGLHGLHLLAVLDRQPRLHLESGSAHHCLPLERALQPLAARTTASVVLDGVLLDDGTYIVFDLVPLNDFRAGICRKSQRERRTVLELLQKCGAWTSDVRVVPQIEVDLGTTAGQLAYAQFTRHALDHGHESIIIKKTAAAYRGVRSTAWLRKRIDCSA